jgi:hypothetical protein
VVDDVSTDRTGRVAREHGAVVLMVHLRQPPRATPGLRSREGTC